MTEEANCILHTYNYYYYIKFAILIPLFRSGELIHEDQSKFLQAAGQRRSEESRAQQLHARSRILPILQATAVQAVQGSQAEVQRSVAATGNLLNGELSLVNYCASALITTRKWHHEKRDAFRYNCIDLMLVI